MQEESDGKTYDCWYSRTPLAARRCANTRWVHEPFQADYDPSTGARRRRWDQIRQRFPNYEREETPSRRWVDLRSLRLRIHREASYFQTSLRVIKASANYSVLCQRKSPRNHATPVYDHRRELQWCQCIEKQLETNVQRYMESRPLGPRRRWTGCTETSSDELQDSNWDARVRWVFEVPCVCYTLRRINTCFLQYIPRFALKVHWCSCFSRINKYDSERIHCCNKITTS